MCLRLLPGLFLPDGQPATARQIAPLSMNSDVTVTATFTSAPTLVVTPTYKDFGTKKVGQKSTATFTVTNTAAKGVANLTLGIVSIGGKDAAQFTLVGSKDALFRTDP